MTQDEVTTGIATYARFDVGRGIVEDTYPLGKPEAQPCFFSHDAPTGRLLGETDPLVRFIEA